MDTYRIGWEERKESKRIEEEKQYVCSIKDN
jgi:hypothetical protein